jgi:hypothetical protein
MTTKKSQTDFSWFDILQTVLFAIVVALFVFVGNKAGTRAVGCLMIFGAVWQQLKGSIPYGWEGQEPSGFLTGWLALILNIIFAALGFAMLVWPEVAMGILGWSGN